MKTLTHGERDVLARLASKAKDVSLLGEVRSQRSGNTGVGFTYEQLLQIDENNSKSADFEGLVEIKTHRVPAKSKLTMFTLSPVSESSSCDSVMSEFLTRFGTANSKGSLSLHSTIKAGRRNNYKKKIRFHVLVDRGDSLFRIIAEDYETGEELSRDACFHFDTVQAVLENKLSLLMMTGAKVRKCAESEFFTYKEPRFYKLRDFETFISAVEAGVVVLDIRIGTYADGRPHDHGTGWRIQHKKILEVFEEITAPA